MVYRREAIRNVDVCVTVGDFAEARRWMKKVHPSWLPELLTNPSVIVQKMACRRLGRGVAARKL